MSMSVGTEPARRAPAASGEDATLAWLDALAGGTCTPEAFLSAMQEQFEEDRDEGWEVLSLLDQYYRRGKIKPELFHSLKSRLEGLVLNADGGMVVTPIRPRASTPVAEPAAALKKP